MCEVNTVIADSLRSSALLALEGPIKDTIKLSLMLGHVEHCITQKAAAKCPGIDELQVWPSLNLALPGRIAAYNSMIYVALPSHRHIISSRIQVVCDEGMALVDVFASDMLTSIQAGSRTDARTVIKLIISRLAGSVGASLPADPKHKQHLSRLALWLQSGKKRKGLQMDCAGLTLAVFCVCHLLQDSLPALADVRMSVRCPPCIKALSPSITQLSPATFQLTGEYHHACTRAPHADVSLASSGLCTPPHAAAAGR